MNGRQVSVVKLRYVFAMIMALLLGFGYRSWRNSSPQSQNLAETKKSVAPPGADAPAIGVTLSPLHGHTLSDKAVTIDFSHREAGTLLLVLSPVCPYCRVNFHNWRKILQTVSPDRVIWVDLTGTADARYLDTVGIPDSANLILLDKKNSPNNLIATPTTVLLDPHGVVRWSWAGVIKDEQMKQLQGLLTPFTLDRD